jgi:hypothetical protein
MGPRRGRTAGDDLVSDPATAGLPLVARAFVNNLPFTCGLTIQYEPSAVTGAPVHQALASGFDIGKRFHSAPVVRLADAKPMQLGHCIEADARFRVFLFAPAGDAGQPGGASPVCATGWSATRHRRCAATPRRAKTSTL